MVDLTMAGITTDKQQIVDELGYGTNAKLMLQFATPTWRTAQMASGSSFTDVGELQCTWDTSRGQDGAQGILTNYVGGARGLAISAGTPEERAAEAVPWIDTVFPGAEAAYLAGSAVRSGWIENPNARGSYACYRPGQWAFYGLEGERTGNLHFCGEHTSLDFQGYMEGAAETGALVAAELLDELGVEAPARLAQVLAPKLALPQACYRAPAHRLRRNQRRRAAGAAGGPRRVRARAP
jgi:monoamine oxidase